MQAKAVATAGSTRRKKAGRCGSGAGCFGRHVRASSEQVEPVADPEQPRRRRCETASSSTTPWNSGCHSGSMSKTKSRSPMVRKASAPKIAPMALPLPPNSDTPPSTTAAIEYSV